MHIWLRTNREEPRATAGISVPTTRGLKSLSRKPLMMIATYATRLFSNCEHWRKSPAARPLVTLLGIYFYLRYVSSRAIPSSSTDVTNPSCRLRREGQRLSRACLAGPVVCKALFGACNFQSHALRIVSCYVPRRHVSMCPATDDARLCSDRTEPPLAEQQRHEVPGLVDLLGQLPHLRCRKTFRGGRECRQESNAQVQLLLPARGPPCRSTPSATGRSPPASPTAPLPTARPRASSRPLYPPARLPRSAGQAAPRYHGFDQSDQGAVTCKVRPRTLA